MKIALIAPDDLSTLIFCKTLSSILNDRSTSKIFTISPVDMYRKEVGQLQTTHIDIQMKRYLHPVADIKYFYTLYRLFKKERFDCVLTFTTKPNVYGTIAAKLAGLKNINMAIRGMGRMFLPSDRLIDKGFTLFVKTLYQMACISCKNVWVTSESDKAYIISNKIVEKNKVFITKNAINLNDYSYDSLPENWHHNLQSELGLKDKDLKVIMVARLIWAKGIREYAEAAVLLKDRFPNLHFLLVAPSEPKSPGAVPETYIKSKEEKSNLKWLGFRKDVKSLYAFSDIAVLPSYYKEGGYPRALLEPMAFSKPVIAGDTDVCRGPVEHERNGYIVPVKDSQALADAIALIVADDEKRNAFGKYSFEKVKKEFDDQVVFEKVMEKFQIS